MSVFDLMETLGLESTIKNLKGSRIFFGTLISNFKNNNNERYQWSNFGQDKIKNFKASQKEILGKDQNTVFYRLAGKLFVIKKIGSNWQEKMIYGN